MIKKNPITIIEIGIISKDFDTKSGTLSGILIVKFFFLHHLNSSTAIMAPNIETNRPFVPKYVASIPPSLVISTAKIRYPITPIVTHPGTSNLCDLAK